MMRLPVFALLLALVTSPVLYAETAETDEPLSFSTEITSTITARVQSIDHETRAVTLQGPQGNEVSFTASDAVQNLAQVQVGDLVEAELTESFSIEVLPGDGTGPGTGSVEAVERTKAGELPGVAAFRSDVIVASVVEINLEEGTFKLQGPAGNVQEYRAVNPANLERASEGDMVVMTVSQSLAMAVRKPDAAAEVE